MAEERVPEMIAKVVHYKVKKEELETARKAISEFVASIKAHEPSTYYETFQNSEDETRFFHIMKFSDSAAEETHKNAKYTLKFVDVLYSRCNEAPKFTDISSIATT